MTPWEQKTTHNRFPNRWAVNDMLGIKTPGIVQSQDCANIHVLCKLKIEWAISRLVRNFRILRKRCAISRLHKFLNCTEHIHFHVQSLTHTSLVSQKFTHSTQSFSQDLSPLHCTWAVYNHWTGLVYWNGGLDRWTGLVDWTGGLTFFASKITFRVIVVHCTTMQGIAGKWVCFESLKHSLLPAQTRSK